MLLNDLAEYVDLKSAAEGMAGNYQKWRHFMFFGEDKFPHPEHLMLAYTVGPNSTVSDDANHAAVAKALAPFMGMGEDPTKTADNFKSSLCGDRDALKGFMVRVYDEAGEVTEAFHTLFNLSRDFNEYTILDDDLYRRENRKTLLDYVHTELVILCRNRGIQFSEDLVAPVTDSLIGEGEEYDNMSEDLDERIAETLEGVLVDKCL